MWIFHFGFVKRYKQLTIQEKPKSDFSSFTKINKFHVVRWFQRVVGKYFSSYYRFSGNFFPFQNVEITKFLKSLDLMCEKLSLLYNWTFSRKLCSKFFSRKRRGKWKWERYLEIIFSFFCWRNMHQRDKFKFIFMSLSLLEHFFIKP